MKYIKIDSEAYKSLASKIDLIAAYITERSNENIYPEADPSQIWISDKDASAILRVSRRTMQRLRSCSKITYSIRGGKVWYTLSEVKRHLSGQVMENKK